MAEQYSLGEIKNDSFTFASRNPSIWDEFWYVTM